MGSSLKVNAVRDLIKQEQPDLLLIQETKISDQDFQNHIKRSKNYTGTAISAAGALGGIGTIWNKNKWDLTNQNSCNWNANEKLGGNFFADPSRDSPETLTQAHNLIDIPPHNGKYTWSNKRTGINNIKERFDRILVHERIVASFPSIKSKIIQASASDHKHVVLTLDKERNLGPLPFKYIKAWDYNEEFQKLVQEQWAKEVVGSPQHTWETKLKSLRTAIKQWARDNAAVENKKRLDLHKQLEQWNQEKENIQYTEEDQTKENEMYRELYRQNRMRTRNQIDKILVEGKETSDQEEIKEAYFRHFQSLLSADLLSLDNTDFLRPIKKKITDWQNRELDQDVSEEEIKLAAFSMQQDKAPGPDGFTVAFYRNHWDTIKKDFIRMVKNVFQKHKMGVNTKSSHLALIPKDLNPLSFDHFHLISLCNVSYKIDTKILSNRLKKLLPHLISENQGGFVPHRQITDNVILIQEAIHISISRKERGMIIKLDMANAFDRVNHHFLREVLRKFGISNNFISIIMECITHPWIAPLINGRPSNYFRSSRGLRQGYPLSPFLYIIMAETLSIHLEKLRKQKDITGISIERGIKEINRSLFADDTLLIGGASSLMAKRFKKTLDTFLTASGGKLNNKKCKIYTWNVSLQIMQRISTILDILVQRNWSYFSYLGLPLAKETVKS
eukprot:PITA_07185